MTRPILAAIACLGSMLLPANSSAATDIFFDYLYIEASSGSSAGGHAAVRFGEDVYHFQHADPGIIRPVVHAWKSFDLSYRGLENRPIHVLRVAVPRKTYDQLRGEFHRRYVTQESQIRLLEALRRERALLACLSGLTGNRLVECEMALPGAGYFYPSRRDGLTGFDDSAAFLAPNLEAAVDAIDDARRDVEQKYGRNHLERRIRDLHGRIEALRPEPAAIAPFEAGSVSVSLRHFGDQYRDLLLELLALRVLAGQATPNVRAFRIVSDTLNAAESAVLRHRERRIRQSIVTLVRSGRQDRGYPLLVALARLIAFRSSHDSGMLVVLDTYADDAPTVSLAPVRELPAVGEIQTEHRREMRTARESAFAAEARDEAVWSRFEVAANVALELEEAAAGARMLRSHQPALAPARGASLQPVWPVPQLSIGTAAAAVERMRRQEQETEQRLRELYRYDLLRRNCVTEIFRTIDETDSDLAERIDFAGNANFIPFVSAGAVHESYPVTDRFVLPSYRQQQLRQLRKARGGWRSRLREEMSLSSTVVPYEAGDDAFLFFSSGAPLLRPVLGAANVAFGSAAILAGVLTSPFDRGSLVRSGASGLFYSLPEVAFINIRKGTVPLLPSSWDAVP